MGPRYLLYDQPARDERPLDAEELEALRGLRSKAALSRTGWFLLMWISIAVGLVLAILIDHDKASEGLFALGMIATAIAFGLSWIASRRARAKVRRIQVAILLGRVLEFSVQSCAALKEEATSGGSLLPAQGSGSASGIVAVVAPPGLLLRNHGALGPSLGAVPGLSGLAETRLPKFPAPIPKRMLSLQSVRPLSELEREDLGRIPIRLGVSMKPLWHLLFELASLYLTMLGLYTWVMGASGGAAAHEVVDVLMHLVLSGVTWLLYERHELRKLWYCRVRHKKDMQEGIVVAVSSGPWAGSVEVLAASRLPWTANGHPAPWRSAVDYEG